MLSLFIVVTPFSDGEETTPITFNILLYVTSLPPPPPPTTIAPSSLPGLGTPLQAPAATFLHRMPGPPRSPGCPSVGAPLSPHVVFGTHTTQAHLSLWATPVPDPKETPVRSST